MKNDGNFVAVRARWRCGCGKKAEEFWGNAENEKKEFPLELQNCNGRTA